MATRGFEFAYMLDGSNATPLVRDFVLGAAAAHKVGDLMLIQGDGYVDKVTNTTTEVTGVIMEAIAAADVTAGTTKVKMAVITSNQVWRCSMDAATTALEIGTKTLDTVDCNTLSATDETGGGIVIFDNTELDDEGNVLAHVVFADTSFGNA